MNSSLDNNSRGGSRIGAGRKSGGGKFGERTKIMRVPLSMQEKLTSFISMRGYSIPLYAGRVPAGTPVHSEAYIEDMLDLPAQLVKSPFETFALRVKGDSMIEAQIREGDLLLIDRTLEAISGKIVVASINGEITVKRLKLLKGRTLLVPENSKYQAIEIKPSDDFAVLGVVTNIVRSLI